MSQQIAGDPLQGVMFDDVPVGAEEQESAYDVGHVDSLGLHVLLFARVQQVACLRRLAPGVPRDPGHPTEESYSAE